MKKRTIVALCFLCLLAFGVFKYLKENKATPLDLSSESSYIPSSVILVQIKGEIRSPGIYTLLKGSRVEDLVSIAGGFSEYADKSSINLVKVLSDSEQIEVKRISEAIKTHLININTATIEELKTLDGIGQAKAEAIIKYRDDYGNYLNTQELLKVTGITLQIYERIKDYITC